MASGYSNYLCCLFLLARWAEAMSGACSCLLRVCVPACRYDVAAIALNCGSMYRDCIRDEALARYSSRPCECCLILSYQHTTPWTLLMVFSGRAASNSTPCYSMLANNSSSAWINPRQALHPCSTLRDGKYAPGCAADALLLQPLLLLLLLPAGWSCTVNTS